MIRLIFRNAWRNRRRTILTVLSITVSMFVLATVLTLITALEAWEGNPTGADRVVVQSAMGLTMPLPLTMQSFLEGLEGAECVLKSNWFGGYYQDPDDWFANFATDSEKVRAMWSEFTIDDDVYQKFVQQRTACIVGKTLFQKMQSKGWAIGKTMTLTGTIYPCDPELEIVGTFSARTPPEEEQLLFHWEYFDELLGRRSLVGTYWIKVRRPEDISRLKEKIDREFENSRDRTDTLTEKEFGQQFQAMMGNVKGLVLSVASLVLLVIVLLAANTIAMSARERITEVAVMRTLGFQPAHILGLFLAESIIVSVVGTAIAAVAAFFLFNVAHWSPDPKYFSYLDVAPKTFAVLFGVSAAIGILSAALPALRAARRSVVDGLRFVG